MSPVELARRFERCAARAAAAEWPRRDSTACAFAEWLAGCWAAACPVPPARPAEATSRVGHDPAGLRWFAEGGEILGYVEGHAPGCYRVQADARPPEDPATPGS